MVLSSRSLPPSKSPTRPPLSPASTVECGTVESVEDEGDGGGGFRLDRAYGALQLLNEREQKARTRKQILAFCSAMLNCLCAGSLLLFSLWAPIFQDKLGFSQMQINAVAIAGELGMYLPVPIFGAICDKYGPAKLSFLSSMFFGPSYLLAAHAFAHNAPFYVMLAAFFVIGCGTSSMYFSGVTTCAKNFTGDSRGIALALPIAAFGLSSLWESQWVSRIFHQNGVVGGINVGRVFVFFAGLLATVGVLGAACLVIVPEEKNCSAAKGADEEEAGERTALLRNERQGGQYGTEVASGGDNGNHAEQEPEKGWLNEGTRKFLRDRTMWWFAAGVYLVTGPGESFINNMGTLIRTLYTPEIRSHGDVSTDLPPAHNPIDVATHVSIIALTSTLARLLAGSLSDYLAPSASGAGSSDPEEEETEPIRKRPTVSRMWLLIGFAMIMALAQIFVAMGGVDERGEWFWAVSGAMGAGYGAVFTLAPTVVSVIWGVENFGTNWGIITVTPAAGATTYGLIFAAGYDAAARAQRDRLGTQPSQYKYQISAFGVAGISSRAVGAQSVDFAGPLSEGAPSLACYGKECYSEAFWIMGLSVVAACLCWMWAWKGKWGWRERKIRV